MPPVEPIVLISYSSTDRNRALQLAGDLRKERMTVWIDKADIPAGAEFADSIETGIERCTHMVVILTPASRQSRWVKKEIHYALASGKEPITALFELCKIPLSLQGTHYADFTGSYEEGRRTLVHAIQHGGDQTLPEPAWYWRLYQRFRTSLIAGLVTILAAFAWFLAPPSNTSAMLIQTGEPKVLRLHLENRGWWPSTVLGDYRVKFGDLPIVDETLDLQNPQASMVVPRRSGLDIFLVKRSGFDTKGGLTADQIQSLLREQTVTLEVKVKESDDRAYVRPATVRARNIWAFLNANLPHIFMGAAHVA
jgi:hypothetical protein